MSANAARDLTTYRELGLSSTRITRIRTRSFCETINRDGIRRRRVDRNRHEEKRRLKRTLLYYQRTCTLVDILHCEHNKSSARRNDHEANARTMTAKFGVSDRRNTIRITVVGINGWTWERGRTRTRWRALEDSKTEARRTRVPAILALADSAEPLSCTGEWLLLQRRFPMGPLPRGCVVAPLFVGGTTARRLPTGRPSLLRGLLPGNK